MSFFDFKIPKKEETFFEKIKRFITLPELTGVIQDSFSHKELVKVMSSGGAVYPGVRMQSIDAHELAFGFAEDAWNDPRLFLMLERALDETHAQDLNEIRLMPLEELRRILSPVCALMEQKTTGKMIWLLLKDGRREVADLLRPFLKSVYRAARKEHRQLKQKFDFRERFDKGELNPEEWDMLKKAFIGSGEKISNLERELKEKQKKIDRSRDEHDRIKKEVTLLRQERDRLKTALGKMEKEQTAQAETIRRLEEETKKMPRSEERELKRRLHDLERLERKREHELSELSRRDAALDQELESRKILCVRLKTDLDYARANQKALEEQLDRFRQERERKDSQSSKPISSQSPPPKEKGKRLGIFVDMQNIWITSKRVQKKIDFGKLLELIILDRRLVKAIAYVVVVPELDQSRFFGMLERKGFEIHYRNLILRADGSAKGNWDTGMVVDAIRLVDKNDLDIVHVVSGDGDFIDLLKFLKTKGVRVEASGFPFNTAQDLIKCVDDFFPLGAEIFKDESAPTPA